MAGMGASLVTIMVAARLLPKDELGTFFLVMVVVQFVVIFSDLGLRNTAIKDLSSVLANSVEFLQTAHYLLTVTFLSAIAFCFALWLSMPFLKLLWSYENVHNQLAYAIPIAFLTAIVQIIMSLLVGGKEFRKLSSLSAGIEILRAMLSTAGLLMGFGVTSLFWGMIASRIVGISAIWISMPSLFAFTLQHPRRTEFFKFGGWLYGGSLLSAGMVRCADAMLATYMGTAALAIYSAAMQTPIFMQRLFESMRPALLGYVAANHSTAQEQQGEIVRILTAVLAVAALCLIVFSHPIMTMLYSEGYSSGVPIMQALSAWMAFALVNYFYSIILIGRGKAREALILTVPQLLIMLLTTEWLVPKYGGFGAANALIITSCMGNIIGAKIIAGDDRKTWWALTTMFLRAALPLLLLLIAAIQMKLSFFSLLSLGGVMVWLLVVLKVLTASDIASVQTILSRRIRQASVRSTTST